MRSVWLSAFMVTAVVAAPIKVETNLGELNGLTHSFQIDTAGRYVVKSFLGVPFAQPPIGDLRFRPPKPIGKWDGVRNATKLASSCQQESDGTFGDFWGSNQWNAANERSEDCLYMNIWAPERAKNTPVMVWLFGGGFWYGSASLPLYDGKVLAAKGDVIVVNVNYRLGPFGFLYLGHEDVPGNMGLLDQQMAMKWIKENIAAFGGDPTRVTLFGESAGAASIAAHMLAPGSADLFTNGILESGALNNKWAMDTPERAMQKSKEFADALGCSQEDAGDRASCLRDMPTLQLSANIWRISVGFLEFPLVIVASDENFFAGEDAFELMRAGKYKANTNLIVGLNQDEGNFWNVYYVPEVWAHWNETSMPTLDETVFNKVVDKMTVGQTDVVRRGIRKTYGKASTNYDPKYYSEMVNQMVGDYYFTCDTLQLADEIVKRDMGNVYVYLFAQRSSTCPWPEWTGVMHGYEVEFVFGAPISPLNTTLYTRAERDLSSQMIYAWSRFAHTGTPELDPLDIVSLTKANMASKWPRYTGVSGGEWLLLDGDNVTAINAIKTDECRMWQSVKEIEMDHHLATAHLANKQTTADATTLIVSRLCLLVALVRVLT